MCGCIQQSAVCVSIAAICVRLPPTTNNPPPLQKHTSKHTKVCAGVWNNNNSNSSSCSLRRNVEGVKLEFAHCLTLEAVHCLSLLCETVNSRVFEALFQTMLFLWLVLLQKAPDREQSFPLHLLDTSPCSKDRFQSVTVAMSVHWFFSAMYRSSPSGSIPVIHERKFKPIIKINHEKMNTVEI